MTCVAALARRAAEATPRRHPRRSDTSAGQLGGAAPPSTPCSSSPERVGGERVSVTNLTPPGAEPHDVELTPKDVDTRRRRRPGRVPRRASHRRSTRPWPRTRPTHAFDVGPRGRPRPDLHARSRTARRTRRGRSADPHFWLDPTRLAAVADALVAGAERARPRRRGDVRRQRRGTAGRPRRRSMPSSRRAGLVRATGLLVTSHNAFGYLAERYGLEQVGHHRPHAGRRAFARTPGRRSPTSSRTTASATIYYESLVSPDVAETLATRNRRRDRGARPDRGPGRRRCGPTTSSSCGPTWPRCSGRAAVPVTAAHRRRSRRRRRRRLRRPRRSSRADLDVEPGEVVARASAPTARARPP